MSIGKTIKQLRELRDYTQAYMAEELGISVSGYGKIERDETDITLSRLQQIANVLETKIDSILNFDSTNVFNQYYNKQANGVVQNMQVIGDDSVKSYLSDLKKEVDKLRKELLNQKAR